MHAGGRIASAFVLVCLIVVGGCADEADPAETRADGVERAVRDEPPAEVLTEGGDRLSIEDDDRSVEQRIRDASLAAKVQLALVESRELRAFRFDPVAVGGRILLRGHVETLAQRERAESTAAAVEGVRSVVNEITSTEEPAEVPDPSVSSSDDTADPETAGGEAARGEAAVPDATAPDPTAADATTPDATAADAPAAGETAPDATDSGPETTIHVVRTGDNLWDIARAYGVSVEQIRRLNNLSTNAIRPGQRLRVR